MKKKFIENSLNYIEAKNDLSDLQKKKLKYGLEGFYNLFTKLIVLLIITISFDLVKEFLLLTVIYSLLRLYGFGIHAKKSWQCWLTTVPIYVGGCFFIKYIVMSPIWANYIIFAFCTS